LLISKSVLEEFLEVTENPKIRRYVHEDEIILFLGIVGSIAKAVRVRSKFSVIKEDPDDDAILRTAKDGKADFIVLATATFFH
jgi:putative PIN family toxin of toxin-antitoxin system